MPVKVPALQPAFDLDLDAIAAAITPRTRIVVVNTPNNPSGRIYPPALLSALAAILEEASARHGRRIWIVSDEPYNRIVFDGGPSTAPRSSTRTRCSATATARRCSPPASGSATSRSRRGCPRPPS